MSDNANDPGASGWSGSAGSFTETTTQSWFSRLGGALGGILIGLILLPLAGWGLFWNEGRAVQTARSLAEGAGLVRSVPAEQPDPANEGRLIHVSGAVRAGKPPGDAALNIAAPSGALRLLRQVEMYQWQEQTSSETRTKLGGGTETVTTYSYRRVWQEGLIDSSRFRQPEGHQNPQPRHASRAFNAPDVMLGGFRLTDAQVSGLSGGEPFAPPGVPGDGVLFLGANAEAPRVGDLRITWRVIRPEALSIIAAQSGDGFAPYPTRAGDRLFRLDQGRIPAAEMIRAAEAENALLTWILRLVGTVVIFIGWLLLFNPLKVLADVIPPLGWVVGLGTGLIAGVLTLILAPTIIAIAWLVYRPLVGIAILAVGFALAFGLTKLRRTRPALQGKPA
ncbi:MAG: TMEM43 family protein [Roseococcus sp.]|nr:TMEM43 family protein [Roseococcus sp.]